MGQQPVTTSITAAGLFAVSAVLACGERPSKVDGAPRVAPSESYRFESGEEEGFLWYCVEGERVRMFRSCDEKRCGKWRIARGPCGAPMPDEPAAFKRRPMAGAGWW